MAFADAMVDPNNALTLNTLNDGIDIPLSVILDHAIQRTYHQLVLMSDMFPSTSEEQKKVQLIEFACKTWQLFLRIYALVKFKRKGHINVSNIISFLNQQKTIFIDTANELYRFSKFDLANARLPNFSIPTAVDVLTTGTYPRLPTCIKERILPTEAINDDDKQNTLLNLNRIIQCRLALSELPEQFHNFLIEKGHVKFSVKNEFEIMLTVVSDDYKKPWRLLNIKFLVKNPKDPNRTLVHPQQVYYIHDLLQRRLYESDKPLLDLFRSLHFFCQSLKLEILFQQMTILNDITIGKFYKICEYLNSKQITIKYWLEYSKNEYDFRFTIMTGEYHDYLQTSHYPPLNWNDHKEIDAIFKSNEILIEKIIHQVVKIRAKRRLSDLQTKFSSITYCSTYIDYEKPSLVVKFMNSKFENETLYIMIDSYSGLYYVNIPFSSSNSNLVTQLELCLNTDVTKLEANILKLRTWFILKRCEISLRHLSYKCTYDLPIVSFIDDETANYFNKIEKNRLYFQLKKNEKTYMMITCKTKEDLNNNKEEINWHENAEFIDDENAIRLNYYILKYLKCKYEGDIDPSMQYYKIISISHLKRNSIMNFLDYSSNSLLSEYENSYTTSSYEIENNGCIYEVIKLVSSIEERLPLLNFISTLSKQNLLTQSLQIDYKLANSYVNILNPPKLDSKEMQNISEDLWKIILKCKIRKIDIKSLIPTTNLAQQRFNSQQQYFNYSIEFLLREKLFENRLQKSCFYDLSQYFHGTFDLQQYSFYQQHQLQNYKQQIDTYNPKSLNIDSYTLYLDVKNIDDIYETFKLEWLSMCQMYKLIRQMYKAFKQYPELKKQIRILNFNFKQLVIGYGHNFGYKILFQWSKETKLYDIYLLANSSNQYSSSATHLLPFEAPTINYQFLFINEIKKFFNEKNLNIVNLIQILNETCLPSYSLSKLYNLPKFYAYQQTVVPLAGFMLLIKSLTHFKLTYYSRYCLEIHIHNNGLVSIRDGSFGLTDMNMAIEDLHPIQLLSAFLHKFWDDNVEELLKRRSSIVEDDNPMSPIQNNVSSGLYQQQQQQVQNLQQQPVSQPHVFLPPTSPAVRPSSAIPPSPLHNYVAQSPGGVSSQSNQIPSIAPSPGSIPNFGSPALISHSSPSAPHISHTVPSPGGFMSPAPQPPYSVQSPAGSYDFLQSPAGMNMPIKSPFNFMGPSPNPSNLNTGLNMPIKDSLEDITKSTNSTCRASGSVGTHYKKYYSASIPIYLSHNGFMKMLTVNSDNGYTPLETFLASNHLKKALLKYIKNEYQIPNEMNQPLIPFTTKLIKIQIVNEISPNYAAFSLNISPLLDQLQTDILQEYFHSKILCPPYRTTAALSYFILLNIPEFKILKEFIYLLENELTSMLTWKLKFSWTIPYNFRSKNAASSLAGQNGSYGPSFTRKDNKYFFLINITNSPNQNQQRMPPLNMPIINMPFLMCYDSTTFYLTYEYIKQNEQIGPSESRVLSLMNQCVEASTSRSDALLLILGVLNQMNQVPSNTMLTHHQSM